MKKTTTVLAMIILTVATAFAAPATATLNLTTTISGFTNTAIVQSATVPGSFPDANANIGNTTYYPNGAKNQTLSKTSTPYFFMIETNQTLGSVSIQAKKMTDGTNTIAYTVTAGSSTSTAGTNDGASVVLMSANANVGKRLLNAPFSIQGAASKANGAFGLDDAPAGTYTGTVVISYTAT